MLWFTNLGGIRISPAMEIFINKIVVGNKLVIHSLPALRVVILAARYRYTLVHYLNRVPSKVYIDCIFVVTNIVIITKIEHFAVGFLRLVRDFWLNFYDAR
jgi:hypothetical protein